ncbi:MAG: VCBS repeat-containing protein [Chloroflexota bacterium]|nr:VCBS repeat-containing protein [Chloroflexota bacterium]
MSISRRVVFIVALGALALVAQSSAEAAGPGIIHPIMDLNTQCLLGGSQDGKWVKPEVVTAALKGGEKYRLYSLAGYMGQATGSKATSIGVPCEDTQRVTISPAPKITKNVYAVGATWAAEPRVPRSESLNQVIYQNAVRDVLKQKGLTNPKIKLTQVLRVDLEGDGVPEVLVSATYSAHPAFPSVAAGDYSLVLLRKVIKGKTQTFVIDGEAYAKDSPFAAPNTYTVTSVLDLNGDGTMEVVVDSRYYEGEFSTVYQVKGSDIQPVLECGCGV